MNKLIYGLGHRDGHGLALLGLMDMSIGTNMAI